MKYIIDTRSTAGWTDAACQTKSGVFYSGHTGHGEPDFLRLEAMMTYGGADYCMGQMFMRNQREVELKGEKVDWPRQEAAGKAGNLEGAVLLAAAPDTEVLCRNITLEDRKRKEVLRFPSCVVNGNTWETLTNVNSSFFRMRARIQKEEGRGGFRLYFHYRDEKNYLCWEFGGRKHTALTELINGCHSELLRCEERMESGRAYDLELRAEGNVAEIFVNGKSCCRLDYQPEAPEPLCVDAFKDMVTGDILVKAVNRRENACSLLLVFEGMERRRRIIRSCRILEKSRGKRSGFGGRAAMPVIYEDWLDGNDKALTLPGRSVSVFRISSGS